MPFSPEEQELFNEMDYLLQQGFTDLAEKDLKRITMGRYRKEVKERARKLFQLHFGHRNGHIVRPALKQKTIADALVNMRQSRDERLADMTLPDIDGIPEDLVEHLR